MSADKVFGYLLEVVPYLVDAVWSLRTVLVHLFFWTSVAMFTIAVGVTLFHAWHARLPAAQAAAKLPRLQVWPLINYVALLSILYKSHHLVPPLCRVFQGLCGIVAIFRKSKIAVLWVPFRPVVFFFSPEAVEKVLTNSASLEKSREYKFLNAWLSTGLLTSSGEKWKTRRKLLTPAFHFRILEEFVPVFDEQSQILVKKMKSVAGQEWTDLQPLVTLCTLDIICETAMGVKINAQHNSDSQYVRAIHEVSNIIVYRVIQPWIWLDWMFRLSPSGRNFFKNLKILHGFTRQVIKEKKEALLDARRGSFPGREQKDCNEVRKRKVFLELLLEHHLEDPSFSEEDIREEVDTFMFEGHDTTSNALTWALYNIGLYPAVQQQVVEEINQIFGEDRERSVTSEDIKAMKHLECVLKESLRLYPSVPFISREARKEFDVLGYKIIPGCLCLLFPYMLHRDATIYSNPEVFDPERFLPENIAGRNPYAYVPFSAGPRNCIGQRFALMEEKTIIANILRNFTVESLDPPDKVHIKLDIILRSAYPLRMRLIPR